MADQIQDLLFLSHGQGLINKESFFSYVTYNRLKTLTFHIGIMNDLL